MNLISANLGAGEIDSKNVWIDQYVLVLAEYARHLRLELLVLVRVSHRSDELGGDKGKRWDRWMWLWLCMEGKNDVILGE